MKLNPAELLEIHAILQRGTYFSNIQTIGLGKIKFAYSDLIDDFYWNYAYNFSLSISDFDEGIRKIKEFSSKINRQSCILP